MLMEVGEALRWIPVICIIFLYIRFVVTSIETNQTIRKCAGAEHLTSFLRTTRVTMKTFLVERRRDIGRFAVKRTAETIENDGKPSSTLVAW